jgi:hypothetical protein
MADPRKVGESAAGNRGKGRKKGVPNKTTALLKDAIIQAATEAGNGDLVEFLKAQANKENNAPFMSLVGKVVPMQVTGADGGGIVIEILKRTYDD